MVDILRHRGPDDVGYYRCDTVKLGACRLAIVDRDGGAQPFGSPDGHQIVFNGEIFNFKSLRAELQVEGYEFSTSSDTEVALAAFRVWGVRSFARLTGMFALAIWDGSTLILARDRVGEKPLFYAQSANRFLFGSEIKALLQEFPTAPNLTEAFQMMETPIEPETLYEGIYCVPAGAWLRFDGTSLRTQRYWELSPASDATGPASSEELLSLLRDAIAIRSNGEAPVAAVVSGGLDSGLVAALSGASSVYRVRASGRGDDEGPYARLLASALGAELYEVEIGPMDFQRELVNAIWYLDQPVASTAVAAEFALMRAVADRHTVVLSGIGADEAFGGYARYVLLSEESRLAQSKLLEQYRSLARFFWSQNVFGPPEQRYYELLRRGATDSSTVAGIIGERFERHRTIVDKMGAADFALTLPCLLQASDRAASAASIENRSPFLDHRVLELAFTLPAARKIDDLVTKVILREAARGVIPDQIIDRPDKIGFALPVGQWLTRDLGPWTAALKASLARRGIAIDSCGDRGEFDRTTYTAVMLELWFRTFVDRTPRGPLSAEDAGIFDFKGVVA